MSGNAEKDNDCTVKHIQLFINSLGLPCHWLGTFQCCKNINDSHINCYEHTVLQGSNKLSPGFSPDFVYKVKRFYLFDKELRTHSEHFHDRRKSLFGVVMPALMSVPMSILMKTDQNSR